jgi:3-deoxy-D-manno-octulosonate 8-phosphate phosphatase (KDO 8-P phosphatase)
LRGRARSRTAPGQRTYSWRANLERAKGIKLLLLDVDGVLTDGSIIYTPDGKESKAFSTRDGLGLRLVQKAGLQVGLITARTSEVVQRRAENLGISLVYQGAGEKLVVFQRILAEQGLQPAQVAYVGDDWLDLPLLTRVGLAVAVADGAAEVREVAHYVTELPGGRGAVREVCDLLVEALGVREALLAEYLAQDS